MLYRFAMGLIFFVATGFCSASAQDAIEQPDAPSQDTVTQETTMQSNESRDLLHDIHFFQFFYKDGAIDPNPYVDAGVGYYDYNHGSSYMLGVQGGMSLLSKLQLDCEINLVNWDPEYADQEVGMSDLLVSVRYLIIEPDTAKFAQPYTSGLQVTAGGYCTLPVGSEEIGEGNFSLGAYSAARYPFKFGMIFAANVGLDYIETANADFTSDDYELSLSIGAGAIYPLSDQTNIVGELHKKTEIDYLLASAGVDHQLGFGGHLRAAMGTGLSDAVYGIGSTDFMLTVRFMYPF